MAAAEALVEGEDELYAVFGVDCPLDFKGGGLVVPTPLEMAQPVAGLLSTAFATGKPSCWMVACGFTSFRVFGFAVPVSGFEVILNSLSTKLPFAARPGPSLAGSGRSAPRPGPP